MLQESSSQHRRKYYRSIQYRSASFDIKPNKIKINTQRFPIFQINKKQNSNNQSRTSKRNLFRTQQNLKHFSKSLSQSLSKAKQFQLTSTLISQTNPQQENFQNFGKCSYLESFQQLMQNDHQKSIKKKKLTSISIKLQSLKNNSKIDRIALPNIIEYQNSEFTALDPINLSINGIKQQIERTKKQIEQCPNKLKSIRCQIGQYKEKNIKEIDKYSQQFMNEIKKLWLKLRENTVHQQSFLMRIKRQLNQLETFVPQFRAQFKSAHQKQLEIQTVIFQTAPFQLKRSQCQKQKNQEKNHLLQQSAFNLYC